MSNNFSFFRLPSGDVSQIFRLFPFFSPNITNHFAGSVEVEEKIVTDIASYGSQLGTITDLVLSLAKDYQDYQAKQSDNDNPVTVSSETVDTFKKLKELDKKIKEAKKPDPSQLEAKIKEDLGKLQKLSKDRHKNLLNEQTAELKRKAANDLKKP